MKFQFGERGSRMAASRLLKSLRVPANSAFGSSNSAERIHLPLVVLFVCTLTACSTDAGPAPADEVDVNPSTPSATEPDAAPETEPVGETEADAGGKPEPECSPIAAEEPFGAKPNEESFPDLQVARCDGSRVTLDEVRCGDKLTLISIGAGWCEPCREETPLLQELHTKLQSEGVSVVQIMFEDAAGNAATGLFCDNWTSTFDLTLPVFIDPVRRTLDYFDRVSTPLNLIVNERSEVLWAEAGVIPKDLETIVRSFLEDQEQ